MAETRVLVVEDDEIARSFLADILRAEGYEVDLAEDGGKALAVLESRIPDLVISDVIMPEVSGIDLFRRMQAEERYQNVPFIFLTCLDDGDDRFRIEELGPDDYMPKPVRPRQLLATVRGKLRRSQVREEMAERERDRLRDGIRCTLTHELRTPLTVIQAVAEMLMSDRMAPGLAEYQDLLESLRAQSFRLGGLVENFLLVARIDSGAEDAIWRAHAGPFQVALLIDEALVPWFEKSRDAGVDLRHALPDDLPMVRVHRQHILEVLHQVLDNAFKFAGKEHPRVEVGATLEGAFVRVTVSDNGPGIPHDRKTTVFAKLAQVDRQTQEQQGSGLGLYIAKRLLDVNGGGIAVDDAPGGGTVVGILLPVDGEAGQCEAGQGPAR